VLDILMPGIDGWELLTRLKGDPATAAIPVIMASILDERGHGFALGAAEYVVKPVEREALLDALARCAAAAPRTVVAIDDDPRALDVVQVMLEADGWTVERATGGEEGVELARRVRPSVVLLDLLMPGVDGFAVVERLRADPELASIPIVVLTAKDMTAGDFDRLNGRIGALAQKGTLGAAELTDLLARVAAAR
jgi:CheY-like chemotaxis protein